jgi:arylsulfatase A-like enzyme/Flp pilus assembly protein TadD
MDQLAREGLKFEKAFSSVPLTLPAHASILTGTYPTYHGIRDNSGFVLPDAMVTLAEVLESVGYQTAAFVGAFVLDSKFGLDQGFSTYFDDFDLSEYENVSPGYIQRRGDEVVAEAVNWLQKADERPFFMWVHLYDPHDPYTPPEPYASRHPGRPYDGEVEFTDFNLGQLLSSLKEQKVYEDTLILLVGDHGESLGEHGEEKHGFFVYNSALHVPLILRLPHGKRAAQTVQESVSIVDLFPTVIQLLGLPRLQLDHVQGTGLGSLILGRKKDHRADLYAETFYPHLQFGWSPLRTLISGSYKYIEAPSPELYDLSKDFAERNNLAEKERALANRFQQNLTELEQRLARSVEASESEQELDAATLERLRSLGYVSLSLGSAELQDFDELADPKEQISLYNQITELFSLSQLGEYAAVIPEYEKILSRQPGLKIVRYKLGQAYYQTQQYDQALSHFKRVIEAVGEESLAIFDLAQTYLRMGRSEDALLGFERTIEIDPHHYRARTNLGVLYKNRGQFVQAADELEKALKLAPNSVFVLSNIGVVYSMLNRHKDAQLALENALALAPENAAVCANLGVVYKRMGQDAKAREFLERARKLDPNLFKRGTSDQ